MKKILISNKNIGRNYSIIETYIAGISLFGYEVKSIKNSNVSLNESFITVKKGEVYILHMHVSPIPEMGDIKYNPTRTRKLLLNRYEINEISKYISREGYTLVPINIFLLKNKIKLNIAVVKGLKKYDKREKEKEKTAKRDMERSQNMKYRV
jgi:SsrA-binding protein